MRILLALLVGFGLVCVPTAALAQDKDDVSPDLAALNQRA